MSPLGATAPIRRRFGADSKVTRRIGPRSLALRAESLSGAGNSLLPHLNRGAGACPCAERIMQLLLKIAGASRRTPGNRRPVRLQTEQLDLRSLGHLRFFTAPVS